MGILWAWLFGKSEEELKNMKQKRIDRINALQSEVEAIDAELKKQKSN